MTSSLLELLIGAKNWKKGKLWIEKSWDESFVVFFVCFVLLLSVFSVGSLLMVRYWQQNLLFYVFLKTQKHQIWATYFGPLEAFLIFLSVSIILTSLRGSFDTTELWFRMLIEHSRCHKVDCSKRLILYKKLTVYSNWLLFGKSKYWSLNSYCLAIFWLLFDVFYFLIS